MKLLIAIQHCDYDIDATEDLIRLICELQGNVVEHRVVIGLVTRFKQRPVHPSLVAELKKRFSGVFESAVPRAVEGWPAGPNAVAIGTLSWASSLRGMGGQNNDLDAVYLMEPDVCPVNPHWIQQLIAEWQLTRQVGKLICGNVLETTPHCPRHVNGSAIFSWDTMMRINQLYSTPLDIAWDIYHRQILLANAAHTSSMLLDYKKPTATPEEFAKWSTGPLAVVHGVKDQSLRRMVREKFVTTNITPYPSVAVTPESAVPLAPPPAAPPFSPAPLSFLPETWRTFRHTGDLGDVIAFLPILRAMKSPVLFLSDVPAPSFPPMRGWGSGRLEAIMPLLRANDYVKAKFYNGPAHHDVQRFRHGDYMLPGRHLGASQSAYLGIKANWTTPWLTAKPDPRTKGKVVIHRSARYHNPEFPWKKIVRILGQDAVFVGLEAEYQALRTYVGADFPVILSKNLQETAELIAGADLLITNQTCVFWLGEGLKVPLLLEVSTLETNQDCLLPRQRAWHYHSMKEFGITQHRGKWTPAFGEPLSFQQKVLNFAHRLSVADTAAGEGTTDVETFWNRRQACGNCRHRRQFKPQQATFYKEVISATTQSLLPPEHGVLSGYCELDTAGIDEKIRLKEITCAK